MSSRSVPIRVAAVGVIVGLVIGGLAVETFSLQLGGNTPGVTTTVTRTSIQTISTVTSISRVEPQNVVATTTVTAGVSRAHTIDLQATQLLYYGGSPITFFGTIYPPPSATQGIVIATRNPNNLVVDIGQAQTSGGTGSFSYVIGATGTLNWIPGAYSVSATSGSRNVSTIFYFSQSLSGTTAPPVVLNVLAPPLVKAGDQVNIPILATLPNGAPDNVTLWSTLTVLFPDGVFHPLCVPNSSGSCAGTFSKVQVGFYQVLFTLPSSAQQGTYFVEAAVTDSAGGSARTLSQFSVQ